MILVTVHEGILFEDFTFDPTTILTNYHDLQALNSIAEAAYQIAESSDDSADPTTYMLSPYYESIVQKLLQTTDRSILMFYLFKILFYLQN